MANTDRARKLLVRTALVTSTTIATLIGAQNFAMLDARDFQMNTKTDGSAELVVVTPSATITPAAITRSAPGITVIQAAPSITILRQAGQVTTSQQNAPAAVSAPGVASIQPPAPSQLAAPQPVVVQQPAVVQQAVPQRSRSSR